MIPLVVVAVGCLVGFDGQGTPPPADSYEQLKAVTGRDAEAQIKLALWCEAHGLENERLKHLATAVLADPSNAMARGLMGLVEFNGKWRRPEAVAEATKADVARADLLAEYNGRRVKTPVKPDAQYKLALWCEEKGLKDEARAHLATVVRLDPKHTDAWRRMGYKKVSGRWVTDVQAAAEKAEHEAQQAADRRWRPRLERLREALGRKGAAREQAERDLAAIIDRRAVPMVWKVFVQDHQQFHPAAVQVLGQIDATSSSRSLAMLGLWSPSDEARRRAKETLRRRDPREWADLVIAMIRQKVRYEVKPVNGPNSPGVLFVEAPRVNSQRIYRAAAVTQFQPGDQILFDRQGRPVLSRPMGPATMTGFMGQDRAALFAMTGATGFGASLMERAFEQQAMTPVSPSPALTNKLDSALANTSLAGKGQAVNQLFANQINVNQFNFFSSIYAEKMALAQATGGLTRMSQFNLTTQPRMNVPLEQLERDARASAQAASAKLKADVAAIDDLNEEIARSNQGAILLLAAATGQSFGDDRRAWEKWFTNQVGYAFVTPDENKPTVVEEVPIDYRPTAVPVVSNQIVAVQRMSCFGQGTPVRTLSGTRPIEELKVGDLVLTQDIKSGRLRYKPVVVVHHNPPSPTYRVDLNGQPVISSHFHRFWVASRGWVMARDLKVGDPIRTLGGVSKVTAIEPDKVQLVYNLDVADDADFFAGNIAALVHDNTLPDLRLAPFDAPSVASLKGP